MIKCLFLSQYCECQWLKTLFNLKIGVHCECLHRKTKMYISWISPFPRVTSCLKSGFWKILQWKFIYKRVHVNQQRAHLFLLLVPRGRMWDPQWCHVPANGMVTPRAGFQTSIICESNLWTLLTHESLSLCVFKEILHIVFFISFYSDVSNWLFLLETEGSMKVALHTSCSPHTLPHTRTRSQWC